MKTMYVCDYPDQTPRAFEVEDDAFPMSLANEAPHDTTKWVTFINYRDWVYKVNGSDIQYPMPDKIFWLANDKSVVYSNKPGLKPDQVV